MLSIRCFLLTGRRLRPKCRYPLIDVRIHPYSLKILFQLSNKSNNSWLMGSIFAAPNWSVFEKLSRIAGFLLGARHMSSNLKAQSSDRLRMVSLPALTNRHGLC